jgi:DnaA N-terminal domain
MLHQSNLTTDTRAVYQRRSTTPKGSYVRPANFLTAEFDPIHSTYKMLMYREGFSYPQTYYSKKKEFAEAQDKEYVLLSMIERFIGRNNCFYRKAEVTENGKTYSPTTMIEFWRVYQDDTEDTLVLRLFHPESPIAFKLYDYLQKNHTVKQKLQGYYEALKNGNVERIGGAKARRLEIDEQTDFTWQKMTIENFSIHLAQLYSKYPSRSQIDVYKEAYMKKFFTRPQATPNQAPTTPPPSQSVAARTEEQQASAAEIQVTNLDEKKVLNRIWAKCLEVICTKLSDAAFRTWFLPIEPQSLVNQLLVLKLPSNFHYEWLEDNYSELMREVLNECLGKESKIGYLVK